MGLTIRPTLMTCSSMTRARSEAVTVGMGTVTLIQHPGCPISDLVTVTVLSTFIGKK